MRVFSLLFGLYFAVLGCLPCADEVPLSENGTGSSVIATHHRPDEPGAMDWCSPLCSCRCCPGAAVLPVRSEVFGRAPARAGWGLPAYGLTRQAGLPGRLGAAPWQPPQQA